MRRILAFITVMITIAFQSIAKESNNDSSTIPVGIEVHKKHNNSSRNMHRAPMRINIEAYYDEASHTLDIMYDGEAEGEVFLYLNGSVIEYDSVINTSFQIYTPGLYKIEIISESWVAEGYFSI